MFIGKLFELVNTHLDKLVLVRIFWFPSDRLKRFPSFVSFDRTEWATLINGLRGTSSDRLFRLEMITAACATKLCAIVFSMTSDSSFSIFCESWRSWTRIFGIVVKGKILERNLWMWQIHETFWKKIFLENLNLTSSFNKLTLFLILLSKRIFWFWNDFNTEIFRLKGQGWKEVEIERRRVELLLIYTLFPLEVPREFNLCPEELDRWLV